MGNNKSGQGQGQGQGQGRLEQHGGIKVVKV